MMKILIDADGCPVTDLTVTIAARFHVPCIIFCDTAHEIHRENTVTITVDKGADSVDLAIANHVCSGDLVVTQDYGLAALCLAKHAGVLHQDGFFYTQDNIDSLLFFRAAAKKARNAGHRMKGPHKRTKDQDRKFQTALESFLKETGL